MSEERIARFMETYSKRSTRLTYGAGIYQFLDYHYGAQRKNRRVTEEERVLYERLAARYFTEWRNYFDDFMKFIIAQEGRSPIGARAQLQGVKEWLRFNDVDFTPKELKELKAKMPRGKTARTAERIIDVQVLKQILTHTDVKGKALILVLASSGIRIGEALAMKLDDVNLSTTPASLVVRGETTKTGDQRTVFISTEAKEAVQEWLKVRDSYLATATTRNKGLIKKSGAGEKPIEDARLFPFTDPTVRELWRNALRRAQLLSKDSSTGLIQLRIHGLRKFFRSELGLGCPESIVEAFMGHEPYLVAVYKKYTLPRLAEYYLDAEHHVTIFGSGDLHEMQERLKETHKTLEDTRESLQDTRVSVRGYKDIITEQARDLSDMKNRVAQTEKELAEIGRLKEELQELRAWRTEWQKSMNRIEKALFPKIKRNGIQKRDVVISR